MFVVGCPTQQVHKQFMRDLCDSKENKVAGELFGAVAQSLPKNCGFLALAFLWATYLGEKKTNGVQDLFSATDLKNIARVFSPSQLLALNEKLIACFTADAKAVIEKVNTGNTDNALETRLRLFRQYAILLARFIGKKPLKMNIQDAEDCYLFAFDPAGYAKLEQERAKMSVKYVRGTKRKNVDDDVIEVLDVKVDPDVSARVGAESLGSNVAACFPVVPKFKPCIS